MLKEKEIRQLFNQSKTDAMASMIRAKPALLALSSAIAEMRKAGIDVELELTTWGGSDDFSMMPGEQAESTCTGILRIGNQEHQLAVITKNKAGPCLKVYVSYYNVKMGETGGNRSSVYDFEKDKDAIDKLIRKVVYMAARQEFIAENDPHGSFDGTPSKRVRKLAGIAKPDPL